MRHSEWPRRDGSAEMATFCSEAILGGDGREGADGETVCEKRGKLWSGLGRVLEGFIDVLC